MSKIFLIDSDDVVELQQGELMPLQQENLNFTCHEQWHIWMRMKFYEPQVEDFFLCNTSHLTCTQLRFLISMISPIKSIKILFIWHCIRSSWHNLHFYIQCNSTYITMPATLYETVSLSSKLYMIYLHFRYNANYFLLPWKTRDQISRRSNLLYN